LQRLGGSGAPQKVERPHYGIVSCQAKRTTTVASARPRAGGGRGRRNPLAGDPHWLYCAGNSARPLWSPGRDRPVSAANYTTVKTPPSIGALGWCARTAAAVYRHGGDRDRAAGLIAKESNTATPKRLLPAPSNGGNGWKALLSLDTSEWRVAPTRAVHWSTMAGLKSTQVRLWTARWQNGVWDIPGRPSSAASRLTRPLKPDWVIPKSCRWFTKGGCAALPSAVHSSRLYRTSDSGCGSNIPHSSR